MDIIVTSYIDGGPLLAHRPPIANPHSKGHLGYVPNKAVITRVLETKVLI